MPVQQEKEPNTRRSADNVARETRGTGTGKAACPTKGNPIPFIANQVAFSPDSKLLATANTNGTIYLIRVPRTDPGGGEVSSEML